MTLKEGDNSQYLGEAGEAGEVGEYLGDVGDICAGAVRTVGSVERSKYDATNLQVGEYRGEAGLNDGLVGEYRGEVGLNEGDCGL